MRNYISTLFLMWNLHWNDNLGNEGDIQLFAAGGDVEELNQNAALETTRQSIVFPSTYTITITYPNAPVQTYWLFDKTNVVLMANYLSNFWWGARIDPANIPIKELGILQAKTLTFSDFKPRTGWKDDLGAARKPPPSERKSSLQPGNFSGAPGLLAALAALPQLAAKLTAAGRVRDAGIVLYAFDQVIRHTWSITEAFAYLDKNNI